MRLGLPLIGTTALRGIAMSYACGAAGVGAEMANPT